MSLNKRSRGSLLLGLGFLAPNILGFLSFTVIPLVLSMILAFSNWDLSLHNMFKSEQIQFAGLENFRRLLGNADFWKYLKNTLFLMMGTPFGVAGSLVLAMLLSKDFSSGGHKKVRAWLIVGGLVFFSSVLMAMVGMGSTAMLMLLVSVAGMMFISGVAGGSSVYRALFYLPHFTSGVAVYILWTKLYNPHNGPINNALRAPLEGLTSVARTVPAGVFSSLAWVLVALAALVAYKSLKHFQRQWNDGELGTRSTILPTVLVALPLFMGLRWQGFAGISVELLAFVFLALVVVWLVVKSFKGREFTCPSGEGFGGAAIIALGAMVFQFILVGLSRVSAGLPVMASVEQGGLTPPLWLTSIAWAKPAIMIMGFWAGIGSNNMLLYLAGLSNVPQDLYEACDIDGANRRQRFWNVTWPQLAPTTFFIVVMATINGLQGGFEMARTMTQGGPAGATTTLTYFIYTEGFYTGRLGFASATAWTLFIMVFVLTVFNWKFGNRYVND